MKNTELVGMNECFQKDYREIAKMFESVNRTKSAFLANMSHVIRTPINEIIGMAEIVSDTELLGQQKYYLEMIKSSAYFLLKVVNDVLDYSKIEAGILELDNITFSLRHSLNSVMDIFTLRAQKKDIQLVYSIDSDIPDTLIGDPSRFRQIIYNLVDNAVKYTKYGDIHVTVQSEYETDNTVYLRVIVSDKGSGIPLEMQKMIFEAFTHVDSSHKRSQTGSGLGLAISKQLVEMMGGRMWLESTLGNGSTFFFTVKFSIQKSSAARIIPLNSSCLYDIPILIVDDSTNRKIFKEVLEKIKMKPVVAGSGQTALIAMKQARERGNPFEIILIDDQMPEMDGFELARQINLIPEFSGIKIIMLTSGGQSGDAERCKSLNILGYLTKPVKQAELIDTIRTVAGTHITHDSQSPLITRHYLRENRRRRHILLAEDNIINQKVAVSLLEKWGHTVMVVNNGKEAYEAVEKQHFDLILMDLFMPVMNGIEAAQVIRKNKSRSHIPIIAMTASCTNDDKKRCHDAGIDNCISKPFQGEELFELIEKTIKKSIEKSSYDDTCDIIDKDLLLNRVNGDKELLKEVVEIFLKEYPSMLFDIEKAIQDNDTHVLQNSLVTIKSLVSNFSAKSAFNTAVKLEIMAACGDLINAEKAYHTLKSEIEQIKEALIIVIKNDNYL